MLPDSLLDGFVDPGTQSNSQGATSPELEPIFDQAASKYGVSGSLLRSVAHVESGMRPDVVSPTGNKGVMQLSDDLIRQYGISDWKNPAQNIEGGARYLKELNDQFNGDQQKVVAAYQAGPGAVKKYGGPSSEVTDGLTRNDQYVKNVLATRSQYQKPVQLPTELLKGFKDPGSEKTPTDTASVSPEAATDQQPEQPWYAPITNAGKSLAKGAADLAASGVRGLSAMSDFYPDNLGSKQDQNQITQNNESVAKKIESAIPKSWNDDIDAATKGPLWSWDPKDIGRVVNTWTTNIAGMAPMMATALAGPEVGAAAMIETSAGNFMQAASNLGVPPDIARKYASSYSVPAGLMMTVGNLASVGGKIPGVSQLAAKVSNKVMSKIAETVGAGATGGGQMVGVENLQNYLLGKAAKDAGMKPEDIAAKLPKTDNVRDFWMGFGLAAIPHTAISAGKAILGRGSEKAPTSTPNNTEEQPAAKPEQSGVQAESGDKKLSDFGIKDPKELFSLPSAKQDEIYNQLTEAEQDRLRVVPDNTEEEQTALQRRIEAIRNGEGEEDHGNGINGPDQVPQGAAEASGETGSNGAAGPARSETTPQTPRPETVEEGKDNGTGILNREQAGTASSQGNEPSQLGEVGKGQGAPAEPGKSRQEAQGAVGGQGEQTKQAETATSSEVENGKAVQHPEQIGEKGTEREGSPARGLGLERPEGSPQSASPDRGVPSGAGKKAPSEQDFARDKSELVESENKNSDPLDQFLTDTPSSRYREIIEGDAPIPQDIAPDVRDDLLQAREEYNKQQLEIESDRKAGELKSEVQDLRDRYDLFKSLHKKIDPASLAQAGYKNHASQPLWFSKVGGMSVDEARRDFIANNRDRLPYLGTSEEELQTPSDFVQFLLNAPTRGDVVGKERARRDYESGKWIDDQIASMKKKLQGDPVESEAPTFAKKTGKPEDTTGDLFAGTEHEDKRTKTQKEIEALQAEKKRKAAESYKGTEGLPMFDKNEQEARATVQEKLQFAKGTEGAGQLARGANDWNSANLQKPGKEEHAVQERLRSNFRNHQGVDVNAEDIMVHGKANSPETKMIEQVVAKTSGKKVRFISVSDELAKRMGFSPDGFMFGNSKDPLLKDAVFINTKATRPLLWVAGHEVGHFVMSDPTLSKAVTETMRVTSEGNALLDRLAKQEKSADQGHSEFMAEAFGELMARPDFLKQLAATDANAFQKVLYKIVEVLTKMHKAAKELLGAKGEPDFELARHVSNLDDTRKAIARAISDYRKGQGIEGDGKVFDDIAKNMKAMFAKGEGSKKEAGAIPEPPQSERTIDIKDAGYKTEETFRKDYEKKSLKEHNETEDEFLQRQYCGGTLGGGTHFTIRSKAA